MNPKLIKTLLLAAAVGFFIVWIFEITRTDLSKSYWLLMLSLIFVLLHQYYRLRMMPQRPVISPKTNKSTKSKKK